MNRNSRHPSTRLRKTPGLGALVTALLIPFLAGIIPIQTAQGMERRHDQFGKDFSYFLYPIATEIPGLGSATGFGASVLNMFETDTDFTGFKLNGDFDVSGYAFLDMHLWPRTLVLDLGVFDYNVAPLVYRRGMDSAQDDYVQAYVEGDYYLAQLTFTVKERLFEAYYRLAQGQQRLKAVFDNAGNRFQNIDQSVYDHQQATFGMVLDYTDDRLDPRKGIRLEWARKKPSVNDPLKSAYIVDEKNLSLYAPMRTLDTWVFNVFRSDASITRQASTDYATLQSAIGLNCSGLAGPALQQCLAAERETLEERIAENTYGNAGSLGGTQRLRAYPGGRFYAGHALFFGTEYRWNLHDVQEPFDIWIARGVRTGFQLALFAETGSVADDASQLLKNRRSNYGLGARVLFTGVVIRLDWATGDEGSQIQLFINYPFGMFSVDSPG